MKKQFWGFLWLFRWVDINHCHQYLIFLSALVVELRKHCRSNLDFVGSTAFFGNGRFYVALRSNFIDYSGDCLGKWKGFLPLTELLQVDAQDLQDKDAPHVHYKLSFRNSFQTHPEVCVWRSNFSTIGRDSRVHQLGWGLRTLGVTSWNLNISPLSQNTGLENARWVLCSYERRRVTCVCQEG